MSGAFFLIYFWYPNVTWLVHFCRQRCCVKHDRMEVAERISLIQ